MRLKKQQTYTAKRTHLKASSLLLLASLFPGISSAEGFQSLENLLGIDNTINSIQGLENERDPKCYATASRLEDFMYGTPLTDSGRFLQVEKQKQLVLALWQASSDLAKREGSDTVTGKHLQAALDNLFPEVREIGRDLAIQLNDRKLTIKYDDLRQYGTVAYSLRAILGVQQDQLINNSSLLPLSEDVIAPMKRNLDIASLIVLQSADIQARLNNEYELSPLRLRTTWAQIFPEASESAVDSSLAATTITPKPHNFETLKKIISQKLQSYEKYNYISTPVFLRNIQVYFARHKWPGDPIKSRELKSFYNTAMVNFATDLYKGAESLAMQKGHPFLRGEDVHTFAVHFVPFEINEYEDAIFFPKLAADKRVTLESYDMDAFRDGGLHWKYLEAAINEPALQSSLEPDPFAAELLVETIAQFGVLLLRMAGDIGSGSDALAVEHIQEALKKIQNNNDLHAKVKEESSQDMKIVSSGAETDNQSNASQNGKLFTDVTQETGILFSHKTSDWLSRMIRSYSVRDQSVAVLAVPPAFGGSGIAAEDIDGDGLTDVLMLSGSGNKLFKNMGEGQFKDITNVSGINWLREDNKPGEVRQPIIVDFNNDGLQDIFISYVNDKHRLYKNTGDGKFEDVTDKANLGGENSVGGPAVAFDYDNDGLLDLYVTYFGLYTEGQKPTLARRNMNGIPNRLYKNMGGFTFKEVTEGSNLDHSGWAQAVTHTDLNRDGYQDLIVGNDFGVNAYYLNHGDGSFTDIAPQMGVDKPSFTMGIGISDLNNDLYPDIYISNIVTMDKDQKYVNPGSETPMKFDAATMARMRVVEGNDLFLSVGGGSGYLSSELIGRGYSSTGWSWGAEFFDFDNDTDSDLYVTNGMNDYAVYSTENAYYSDPTGNKRNILFPESQKDSNVFFENKGGQLVNVSADSGADLLGNTRAITYIDLESDGDLDMILNNFHSPAVVYRNNLETDNNWLKVRLVGDVASKSNRDAIGARVILHTQDGKRIWREVRSSTAYLASHSKEQHFGLGKSAIKSLVVEWPNGQVQEYTDIKPNEVAVIKQNVTGEVASK